MRLGRLLLDDSASLCSQLRAELAVVGSTWPARGSTAARRPTFIEKCSVCFPRLLVWFVTQLANLEQYLYTPQLTYNDSTNPETGFSTDRKG